MVLPQDDPALRLITEANAAGRFKPVITVEQGTTTGGHTSIVQAALNKVRDAGGGEVFLPYTGVPYRLGKLTIYRNTTFRCAPGVVITRWGVSYGFTNMVNNVNPLTDDADPYSGHGNIVVEGGTWDGQFTQQAYDPAGFDVFYFVAARDVIIRNVKFRDTITNHCLDINGVENLLVDNCQFLGYKDGTTDLSRNYTEAIQIGPVNEDPAIVGTWVNNANGSATKRATIRNNRFGASGTTGTQAWPAGVGNHGAIAASRDGLTRNINIVGNRFEGATYVALPLYTYDNVKVDGNLFTGCQIGVRSNNFTQGKKWDVPTNAWVTAPLRQKCTDHMIINNTFIDTVDADIQIMGTTTSGTDGSWDVIEKVKIMNNTRKIRSGVRTTGQHIRTLLCNDVTIQGNYGEFSSSGISVEACTRVLVNGNTISDTSGYGIICNNSNAPTGTTDYSRFVDIKNNTIVNAGSHGIGASSLKTFSVIGNSVYNNGRLAGGAGILASGSNGGMISANQIVCDSLPFAVNGIQGSSTNTNITADNRIVGVTAATSNIAGTGSTYGELNYLAPVWTSLTLDPAAVVGWGTPQATLTEGGRKVDLMGSLNIPGTYTAGMTIATLPAGMAPAAIKRILVGVDDTAGGRTMLNITTGGLIRIYGNPGVSKNIMFDGIGFYI